MVRVRQWCAAAIWVLAGLAGAAGAEPIVGDLRQLPEIGFVGLQFGDAAVYGTASNIDAGRVRVVLWALRDHWYVQPSPSTPYISVSADGTWSTPAAFWWNLVAVLVDSTYEAGAERYAHPGLDPGVLAFADYPPVRPDLPILFSGYEWGLKLAADRVEYGPNYWGGSRDQIWVDSSGRLHLKIVGSGDTWSCPEVYLLERHGYGTYTFDLETRIAGLDPATILRCFVSEPGVGQLQMEFGPGVDPPYNARRVVQFPWGNGGVDGMTMSTTSVWSTHQVDWRPDGTVFRSWYGSYDDPNKARFSTWNYPGHPLPASGGAWWLFALWLNGGQPPVGGVGDEIIVRSFHFQPLGGFEFAASGQVELSGLADGSGVSVSFSRASGSGFVPLAVKTATNGRWSAGGFQPGTVYRATPIRPGWVFSPASASFSGATSSLAFVGQIPSYTVSGRVALAGQSDHGGVAIEFARLSGSGVLPLPVQTNAAGTWSASGFEPGTVYLATPRRVGWEFAPASSQITGASASVDFTAKRALFAAAGRVSLAGQTDHGSVAVNFARLAGAGAIPAAVKTTFTGAWGASGFESGSVYLVSPSKPGWVFTPASAQLSAETSTLEFYGQRTTFAVSGEVALTGQSDHSGVTITFARVAGTGAVPPAAQTSAAGAWSASGFESGSTYLATPNRAGYVFAPASAQFAAATTALRFAGQVPPFSVSGVVTLDGLSDYSGTTITFASLAGSGAVPDPVQTAADGAWAADGFTPGTSYLATPYREGWAFAPAMAEFGGATGSLDFSGSRPVAGLLVRAVVGSARLVSPAEIAVGRRVVLEVLRYAYADHRDSSAVASFTLEVPAVLGAASGDNALRLTTVAGVSGTVGVRTADGLAAQLEVTTTPGSVDHLVVEPESVSLTAGEQVDFSARGVDSYGNAFALVGANLGWHCVPAELGTISGAGVFTAGPAGGQGYVVAVVSRGLRFGDAEVATDGMGKVVVRGAVPEAFALHQNTPNPFNPRTTIRFDLAQGRPLRLEVYDCAGGLVRALLDQTLPAGSHTVQWDGTNAEGQPVASGLYLVRLAAGDFVAVRKALLVR